MRMTKKAALSSFRRYVLPQIKARYEKDGVVDKSARREAWNNYTDFLCRTSLITEKQYETWSNPY